uniref:RRM domain-containing protein n=1 Tax=Daucus carota subsp. sativus TaxID=79200 RepID=A0A164THH7_DAUCS
MASTVTKPSNGPLGNNNSKGTSAEKSSKGSEIQSKGATNLGNGSFSSGFKEAQLGNNSEQEIKKQQQLETINKFWFLLDHELVAAVNKGNHALLPMAEAKVDFLLGVVSRELLEEGVKGDEEALWSIHEFLYNNGWIEALQGQREAVRMALNQIHYGSIELARQEQKGISMTKGEREDNKGANVSELQAQAGVMAKRGKHGSRVRPVNLQQSQPHSQDSALYINGFRQLSQGQYSEANNDTTLLNFIRANADLVHPNTIAKASNGDQEGVRMALHQIHFGSLSARPIQKKPKFISPNKKDYMVEEQKIITYDFLKVHASMVEPGVLKDALGGNDKALSLALGQIHHHSLTGDHASTKPLPQSPSQTFREALLRNSARPSPTVKRSPPPNSQSSRKKGDMAPKSSIFFTELDDSLHMKDLWSLFKKEGKIRDIILPRKRDKFGNRFGFLLASDEKQADNIISALNGKLIGSRKLYLAKAKGAQKPPSQPPKSASSTRAPKVHITPPESPKSGLGAVNALIRGLSGDRFIAYFPHYMDLQDTDREFLKIGFAEVRDLHLDDLLPSRKTWVEVRGLPIVGWNEDNFKNILSSFGTILQFGKTRDEEDFYQTPKFLLETQSVSEIDEIKYINLMGKIWKVRFLETTGALSQLNDAIPNDFFSYSRDSPANDFIQSRRSCESTKKSEGECMSISSNPAGSTALPEHNHFNDHELVDDEEEVQEILAEDEEEILDEEVILEENRTGNVVLIDSEIETHTLTDEGCENLAREVSNSDINPLTPFSEESPITLAPIDEVAPNFGLGEVEDGPPPAPTLKRKRDVSHATLAGLRARKLRRSASI